MLFLLMLYKISVATCEILSSKPIRVLVKKKMNPTRVLTASQLHNNIGWTVGVYQIVTVRDSSPEESVHVALIQ